MKSPAYLNAFLLHHIFITSDCISECTFPLLAVGTTILRTAPIRPSTPFSMGLIWQPLKPLNQVSNSACIIPLSRGLK
jgi:hypothetical protein